MSNLHFLKKSSRESAIMGNRQRCEGTKIIIGERSISALFKLKRTRQ